MQIEIKVDENCKELKVIVVTEKVTDEVNSIIRKLSETSPPILLGFQEDIATILNEADLYRVYSSDGKVYAVTKDGEYTIRQRMYEIGERLSQDDFIRISNSEIVNLKKIKKLDLSFTGTICIKLIDGTTSYVSRRYVSKIKEILGI